MLLFFRKYLTRKIGGIMKKLLGVLLTLVLIVGCGSKGVTLEELQGYIDNPKKNEGSGKIVETGGKITRIDDYSKSGYLVIEVSTELSDYLSDVVVYLPKTKEFVDELIEGDYIKFKGEIKTVRASDDDYLIIETDNVEKTTAEQANDFIVAQHVIEIDESKENKGVTLTLKRVEFSFANTRVYYEIDNQSKNDISAFYFSPELIAGSKKYVYDLETNKMNGLRDSTIRAGEKIEDFVVYDAIDYKEVNEFTFMHDDIFVEDGYDKLDLFIFEFK